MIDFKIGIMFNYDFGAALVTGDSLIKSSSMPGYLSLKCAGNTIMLIDLKIFKLKFFRRDTDGVYYSLVKA